MVWQLVYFYIICYYLNLRIKNLNRLLILNTRKHHINDKLVFSTISNFYSLYKEISVYNQNYWSKYIFLIVTLYTFVICLLLFQLTYNAMPFMVYVIYIYIVGFNAFILLFLLITASWIAHTSFSSYKILNQLIFSKFKRRFVTKSNLIKVIFLFLKIFQSYNYIYVFNF